MRRTAAKASSTGVSCETETNSVVISPPAESGSYASSFSVSARSAAGISERISSALCSSRPSSVSARSSGVISVTSSAACRTLIVSSTSERSSSFRYSSTSAARSTGSAERNGPTISRGKACATSARSLACSSSVSAGIASGLSSSISRMSGASNAPTLASSSTSTGALCVAVFMARVEECADRS